MSRLYTCMSSCPSTASAADSDGTVAKVDVTVGEQLGSSGTGGSTGGSCDISGWATSWSS